jgi:hypothetical protein
MIVSAMLINLASSLINRPSASMPCDDTDFSASVLSYDIFPNLKMRHGFIKGQFFLTNNHQVYSWNIVEFADIKINFLIVRVAGSNGFRFDQWS